MQDETLSSASAAADTAGQVMMLDGTSTVATTEYSSSSGGYSAGALLAGGQFPAVPDDGDAVCVPGACNPHHNWSVSIPVSTIQAAYPQIGTLSTITVTSRNGDGDFGGRVNQMTIAGSGGSVSVTGNAFAAAMNLQSNWFTISGQPSGGVGGYWLNATDGGVFSFGNAQFYGSTGGMRLNQPVVGMATTHDAGGYWEVATDGGVFSFGDAQFHGSTGSIRLNKPVVGMAVTPDGGGYWLVASDGGIFAYGDAGFFGSTGSLTLNKPVIGMVPTHDGLGYWLIASDGGLFAYGDAAFHGSLGSSPPPTPIVGVAPSTDGGGYWMLEANGTVHAFGDAPGGRDRAGSPPLSSMRSPMTGMIPDFSGQGFDAVNASGQAFAYGDAPYFGDITTVVNGYSGHAVGIAVDAGLRLTTAASRGNRRKRPSRPEATGVDAVVGRVEQPQVPAAVAVGPQHRLLAALAGQESLGAQVDDQAGVLLRSPAVLPLVAAGQEPAPADGEPGGDHAVDPQLLPGGAHVALGRGGDDDRVVALALVPLEPSARVVAQMTLQMPVGEGGGTAVDLVHGEAAEEAGEQPLLDPVGGHAPCNGRMHQGGESGMTARSTGKSPRRLTRKGNTLPAFVSVPSKSKAATVGPPESDGRRGRVGISRAQCHRDPHLPRTVLLLRASRRCESRRDPAGPRRGPRPPRSAPTAPTRCIRSDRRHTWGSAASWCATSTAAWHASPGATTRLTSPMESASGAPTARPVRIRSMARPWPTMRGSRTVPRSHSGTPKRRQNTPKIASSAATRRSHHSASSMPPATAYPSTAAITGLDRVRRVGPIGPGPSVGDGPLVALGHGLEVGAGAEGPLGAGQDGHRASVVAVEGLEDLAGVGRRRRCRPRCAAPAGRS